MSAALPIPAECCPSPPCPSTACGSPIDFNLLVSQALGGQLNIVNVMDTQYAGGAKGDGITDDTAAIQAAIDACLASYYPTSGVLDPYWSEQGLLPLYFPRPSAFYKITAPLLINQTQLTGLTIFGFNSRIQQATSAEPIFVFHGALVGDVQIRGLTFGYASAQTNPASNIIVFEGWVGPGFEPTYHHFIIDECAFHNCYSAIKKLDVGGFGCTVWGCTVRNCRFEYHYGSAIDLASSVSGSGNPCNVFENLYAIMTRATAPFFNLKLEEAMIVRNVEVNTGTNTGFMLASNMTNVLIEQCKYEVLSITANTNIFQFTYATNITISNFGFLSATISAGTCHFLTATNPGDLAHIYVINLDNLSFKVLTINAPAVFYVFDAPSGAWNINSDLPKEYANTGYNIDNLVSPATPFYWVNIHDSMVVERFVVQDANFDPVTRIMALDYKSPKEILVFGPLANNSIIQLPPVNVMHQNTYRGHRIRIVRLDTSANSLTVQYGAGDDVNPVTWADYKVWGAGVTGWADFEYEDVLIGAYKWTEIGSGTL